MHLLHNQAATACCSCPSQVSFSRGNVLTLHNLELDLAPLLGGAAELADVRRAFARRLSVTIPWIALTSQPIQIHLDTVELVLAAAVTETTPAADASEAAAAAAAAQEGGGEPDDAEAAEAEAAASPAAAPGGGGGSNGNSSNVGGGGPGWFGGALQSLALRAGLNVSVKLTNVVAKWVHDEGQCVASVTFRELGMQTSTDNWREGLQVGG